MGKIYNNTKLNGISKMKKLFTLTLLISLLLPFNVYASELNNQPTAVNQVAATTQSKAVAVVKIDNKKDLQNAMIKQFNNFNNNFEIKLTEKYKKALAKDTNSIYKAYYETWNIDPVVQWHVENFKFKLDTKNNKLIFTIGYSMTQKEIQATKQFVEDTAKSIKTQSSTDLEKLIKINDAISNIATYDFKLKSTSYTPYSIINKGEGVCFAYSTLTYMLLDKLGFEHKHMVGELEGTPHSWNLVKLNGQWYHLDVTGNDEAYGVGTGIQYLYFLTPDSVVTEYGYTWNKAMYPKATDTKYTVLLKGYYPTLIGTDFYYVDDVDYTLEKINLVTFQQETIVSTMTYNLIKQSDRLYFMDYSQNQNIVSTNTNGTDLQVIVSEQVSEFTISNGVINYLTEGGSKGTFNLVK